MKSPIPVATTSHFNSLTAPGPTSPMAHITVPEVASNRPPLSAAENLNPSGTLWLTTTSVAAASPGLVTFTVYTAFRSR